MAITFTDSQISDLIQERKQLPESWRDRFHLRPKRGHQEAALDLIGDAGSHFHLIVRQNRINVLDFSIILAVRIPQTNQLFRLRRCNGRSHEHNNQIENERFLGFHIHMATMRYQHLGAKEDTYAALTDRYSSREGAIECLFEDCNFVLPPNEQLSLFQE